ncbi:MAG: polyribonucleotide nucleotidyltransferase [Phycisphaerae bacterium]|nr:polyribonucleotide nucleotidyltransferase [Phycisphaerae bacterium]
MKEVTRIEKEIGSQKLIMETGKIARQSHGALTVRYGDTIVLATALSAPPTRQIDYFPLYVDYREMQYAGGKFPGGFFKREGRPSAKEILTSRMIDRTIRPLWPKDFNNEVQIQCIVVSADKDNDADMLSIIGGSAALALSPAPFLGPIAAVRVGRVDGEFVVFPTFKQREESDFDLIVAGHRDAINMIELGGQEVDEDTVAKACAFGFEHIQAIIGMIDELVEKAGAEKTYESKPISEELLATVLGKCGEKLRKAKQIKDKAERNQAISEMADELIAELCPEDVEEPEHSPADVRKAFYKTEGKIQRELILSGIRPDGRAADEIRPITIDVPALPRTHGSAVFTRGETQAMAAVTLGTPRDQQKIDGLPEEYFKRFLLHYNFPPFSVGEIRPIRGPGRREIGHGALAERSLQPVLPAAEDFPYTVRVVSEILESNGSSSMASVCSATLSLMDAGVPIKSPVAGISVGMVKEGDKKILLTDIIGEEDFHGDMDFKVAGTREGITGIQVDVKPVGGIDHETIVQALEQAKGARMKILDEIEKAIAKPREDISTYAPKMITIKIDPEKIGKVIGPGGKMINGLSTKYEVSIDIEDDGTIFIAGVSGDGAAQARAEIEAMTEEIKVGKIYTGKVVGIKDFGAFIEVLPGQDGLCHISQLEDRRVEKVEDVCNLGDIMKVKVIGIDDKGRVKLSRKEAMAEEK